MPFVRNIAVKVLTVSNNHIHYKLLYCIQAEKQKQASKPISLSSCGIINISDFVSHELFLIQIMGIIHET